MQNFSLLDLAPIPEGKTAKDAIHRSIELAKQAEATGFNRFWLAEHHNMPGIASAATSVLIGHIAAQTKSIRVGAGGIMLPNHSPLVIAEQFGTLATLFPDRIDLGLGRAPGTDMKTARALRRHMAPEDSFPKDVEELALYFQKTESKARVRAIPGEGTEVPIWILGSSLFGAQLAAYLGLPYAFASHFAPAMLEQALATYRSQFRPSATLDKPYVMIAAGVCAAPTDTQAEFLRSSQMLAFAQLRAGKPGKLPYPVADVSMEIPSAILSQVKQALSFSAVGNPEHVQALLRQIIETHQPDELIITGMIHDTSARLESFDIAAKALRNLVA